MYFISKEEDLVGKEIAFTHMARFAEAITIVTKDKGIFVVSQMCYEGDDDAEIDIYNERRAKEYVMKHNWLRKELNSLGIITEEDIKEYEKIIEEKRKRDMADYQRQQEENEKLQYERLKAKFGDK